MLYVTTRNDRDAFTALRALQENRGPDGGMYVPMHMPIFSAGEIAKLNKQSFGETVSQVLNRFFSVNLSSWDVDFTVGKRPVRLTPINHRITVAESWHNPDWDFQRMVRDLSAKIANASEPSAICTDWAQIAVRIAVLFGIFGELLREGIADLENKVDIAVLSGDFSAPMSAWYARKCGLPIGNIICCCNENNTPWDLLYQGSIKCGAVAKNTGNPEADIAVPPDLERLIHGCGGKGEALRFVESCRLGKTWFPEDELLSRMQEGMAVSVISRPRMESTIPNVYRTHGYVLGPNSALTYAGLMDYRAKAGESRHALMLSEKGALCDGAMVARCMGISEAELKRILY